MMKTILRVALSVLILAACAGSARAEGITGGIVQYDMEVYYPSSGTGTTLLVEGGVNNASGPNYTPAVAIDLSPTLVRDTSMQAWHPENGFVWATTPTIKDTWVPVRFVSNLDTGTYSTYYNGVLLKTRNDPSSCIVFDPWIGNPWDSTSPATMRNLTQTFQPTAGSGQQGHSIGVNVAYDYYRGYWYNYTNWGAGPDSLTRLAPTDSVGVVGQANWNAFTMPYFNGGTAGETFLRGGLVYDNGNNVSGMTVGIRGRQDIFGEMRNRTSDANLVDALLNGYAGAHGGGSLDVSLGAIPYSQYDLIVYTDGDLTLDGQTYVHSWANNGGAADYTKFVDGGNYYRITGLTASSLSVTLTKGLYGLQVVDASVPEPATMSLLALAGIAALIRRRRRA
jgi:hypothetical protein